MLRYAPKLHGPSKINRPVMRKYRGVMTDASGNQAAVDGECDVGITVGQNVAGVCTVTFSPRPHAVQLLNSHHYGSAAFLASADTSTVYGSSTGTMGITWRREDTAATHVIGNGQHFELFFLTEEGKS